jgi:hypothetical protein
MTPLGVVVEGWNKWRFYSASLILVFWIFGFGILPLRSLFWLIPTGFLWISLSHLSLQERSTTPLSLIRPPSLRLSSMAATRAVLRPQSPLFMEHQDRPAVAPLDFTQLMIVGSVRVGLGNHTSVVRLPGCLHLLRLERGRGNQNRSLYVLAGERNQRSMDRPAGYPLNTNESMQLQLIELRDGAEIQISSVEGLCPFAIVNIGVVGNSNCAATLDFNAHLPQLAIDTRSLSAPNTFSLTFGNSQTRVDNLIVNGQSMGFVCGPRHMTFRQSTPLVAATPTPVFPMQLPLLGTISAPPTTPAVSSSFWQVPVGGLRLSGRATIPPHPRVLTSMELEALRVAESRPSTSMDVECCTICQSAPSNTYNSPCGCRAYCSDCAPEAFRQFPSCATCRAPISTVLPCVFSSSPSIQTKKKGT